MIDLLDRYQVVVPDYFQDDGEDSLRQRVEWLDLHLGLSDRFLAGFLGTAEVALGDWRRGRPALSPDCQDALRRLWRTVLHLLSLMGMDERQVGDLFERPIPSQDDPGRRHPLSPPWDGHSLRSYLEERGPGVLADVDDWISAFRFGNPYD